jgi:hypothetical protein
MTNFYKETEAIVTRAACREAVKVMLALGLEVSVSSEDRIFVRGEQDFETINAALSKASYGLWVEGSSIKFGMSWALFGYDDTCKGMLAASGRICDSKKLNHVNEYAELLQSKTPKIHEVRQQALEVITPSHPPCIIKLSNKGNVSFSFDPSASLMEGDTVSLDGGGTAIVLEVITAK